MLPKSRRDIKGIRWFEITACEDQAKFVIAKARSLWHTCATDSQKFRGYARTGTLAVRSSLPQLTQAPLMARRIAFQMQ